VSRVPIIKANLVAALKALPGLAEVDVLPSRSSRAPFTRISRRRGIFVVYGGWEKYGQQLAGQPKRQRRRDIWFFVAMAESYRSADDAFTQEGGADDLLEALDSIMGEDIGTGTGTILFLDPDSAELTEAESSTDAGGTVGYVVKMTSSQYMIG
jgi:hypothetical protein